MPGGVYTVQLLDGQSTSSVYSGLFVVLVEILIVEVVGVPLDVEVVDRSLVVAGNDEPVVVAGANEAEVDDSAAAAVSSL